jgi:hypothetical protein
MQASKTWWPQAPCVLLSFCLYGQLLVVTLLPV